MNTIPTEITCERSAVRINYGPVASVLLEGARAFFQIPENEAEFQAWKAARDARRAEVEAG